MPETYENIKRLRAWAWEHDFPVITVRHGESEKYPERLEDQLRGDGLNIPIPMRSRETLGRRQCTTEYKVAVIDRFLSWMQLERATVQLGITVDEWQRAKDSKAKWKTHRFPLLEMGLNRQDCAKIVTDAGLVVPPKSACYFCPFTNKQRWIDMARNHPELMAQAMELEEHLLAKRALAGRPPMYLSGWYRPLREVFAEIAELGEDFDPGEGSCDSGHCFI